MANGNSQIPCPAPAAVRATPSSLAAQRPPCCENPLQTRALSVWAPCALSPSRKSSRSDRPHLLNQREPRVQIQLSPLASLRCFGPFGESINIRACATVSHGIVEPENANSRPTAPKSREILWWPCPWFHLRVPASPPSRPLRTPAEEAAPRPEAQGCERPRDRAVVDSRRGASPSAGDLAGKAVAHQGDLLPHPTCESAPKVAPGARRTFSSISQRLTLLLPGSRSAPMLTPPP